MKRALATFLFLAMIFPLRLLADPIALGAAAPDVAAPNHAGESVNIAAEAAKGLLLVYFYPKADTPGCTAQACSLRDAYAELGDKGVQVIGVSMDTVEAQAAFRSKYELPFGLLADTDGAVVRAFGVPSAGSFAKRQAFLFSEGKLVWHDATASTKKQAEDVLAAVAALPGRS
jgi:peroxiredoxin Q/BCP